MEQDLQKGEVGSDYFQCSGHVMLKVCESKALQCGGKSTQDKG
jgi:hypothetical protein